MYLLKFEMYKLYGTDLITFFFIVDVFLLFSFHSSKFSFFSSFLFQSAFINYHIIPNFH